MDCRNQLRSRLMVGHSSLEAGILGSNPSSAASKS